MAEKRKSQKQKLSSPEGTPCDARGDLVIIRASLAIQRRLFG
jgi:hypothetical protein